MNNKYTVGFIGYGKMAKAISRYINGKTGQIYASDPYVKSDDCAVMVEDNTTLVRKSDVIFLSMKPQNAKEALSGLDFSNKIVVSIMAGLKISKITAICGSIQKIVRVMPNLCAQNGKSVNAFTYHGLNENETADIEELLVYFGRTYKIEEDYFDAVTGLTGSGPAYVFRFVKNLIESGCGHGFSFGQSKDMVLYMLEGCGDILRGCRSLAEVQNLIENVCSKGGTTIEGIYALDAGNFDETVKLAVDSAVKRSKELGS